MGDTPKVLPLKGRVKFNHLSNSSSKNTHISNRSGPDLSQIFRWWKQPQHIETINYHQLLVNSTRMNMLGKLLDLWMHFSKFKSPSYVAQRIHLLFDKLGENKFKMKWIRLQFEKQLAHPFDKACQSCSHFMWRPMCRRQMGQVGFHQCSCFYQDTEEGFRIWKDGKLLIQLPNTKPSKRSK